MNIAELIGLNKELITNSKLHFAIGGNERYEPLYAFYRNEFNNISFLFHNVSFVSVFYKIMF